MTDVTKSDRHLVDAADTRAHDGNPADRKQRPERWRPVPDDFEERFPQIGWDLAKEEWQCHGRSIERWVALCGKEKMVLARKAYRAAQKQVQGRARAKNYVMGRRMTPRKPTC